MKRGSTSLIHGAKVTGDKRELARKFRREPTASEKHAWTLLRARRCLGLKFRRQQVIRGFIVDFDCQQLRLSLEIDGSVHDTEAQAAYDADRTRMLAELGVLELRIP